MADIETLMLLFTDGNLVWQELNSNFTFKFGVLSFVNDTHPALSELFKYFVMEYSFADQFIVLNFVELRSRIDHRNSHHRH